MKSNIRSLAIDGGGWVDLRNIMPARGLDGTSIVIFIDSELTPTLTVPIRMADVEYPYPDPACIFSFRRNSLIIIRHMYLMFYFLK